MMPYIHEWDEKGEYPKELTGALRNCLTRASFAANEPPSISPHRSQSRPMLQESWVQFGLLNTEELHLAILTRFTT